MYDFVCVHTKARTWIFTQIPTALVAVSTWAAVCHGGHRSVQDKVGPGTICKLGGAKQYPSVSRFFSPLSVLAALFTCGVLCILRIRGF